MSKTRNIHRAACTALLYELDLPGYLEGLTLQQIADLVGAGHRSTALRYMRDVAILQELVPELKAQIRTLPMRPPDET